MKITVTQDHIDEGRRGDCGRCPIALAASELFKNQSIAVGMTYIHVGRYSYELPDAAQNFIGKFDAGWIMSPIEFELGKKVRLP